MDQTIKMASRYQISGEENSKPKFRSCVYFSNWSVYERNHFIADIPYKYLTDIFYAFFKIDDTTGEVTYSDQWADIELPMKSMISDDKVFGSIGQLNEIKKLSPGLKSSISIGGWGTERAFQKVMLNSKKMEVFIKSSIELVRMHGFDGIDIDWEYPNNVDEAKALVQLLRGLRKSLDKVDKDKKYLLTFAAPSDREKISTLNLKEMDRYLSFWNVMCYDFCGSGWSSKSGFHSNLFGFNGDNVLNSSDVINEYVSHGISPRKLVLGMPCYGRTFGGCKKGQIASQFKTGEGKKVKETIDYKYLPMKEYEEMFDYRKVSAYCFDSQGKTFVSYDNVQSAKIKAKYVESNLLCGGMWWDSAGDDKEIHKSLVVNFVEQLGGQRVLDKSD